VLGKIGSAHHTARGDYKLDKSSIRADTDLGISDESLSLNDKTRGSSNDDDLRFFGKAKDMSIHRLLMAGAAALALWPSPGRAGPCAGDIDRIWVEIGAKLQARLAAGRSAPQTTIALLHRQPTLNSIATAEGNLDQRWLPMETAVAALARARQADRASDSFACKQAIAEAQRAIILTNARSSEVMAP
jgi:hypothetical protein